MFHKLQAQYGSRWTAQYAGLEDVAMAEWANCLGGLTGDQIRHGLDSLADPWPPSVHEFRRLCELHDSERPARQDYQCLPHPIDTMSASDRVAYAAPRLAELRQAITGNEEQQADEIKRK